MTVRTLLSAALATLALAAAPAASAQSACGSVCLDRLAEAYVDAMVAKAPQRLPWAKAVRYSENGVAMMIGDALWGSITARSAKAIHASDPTTGEAAWIGTVEEHGQPAFFALRLKAVGGRIAEVETIVKRKGGPAPYGDPAAWSPDPAFTQGSPAARKALAAARPGPDCVRADNGVRAAACAGPKVRALRQPLVDQARGLVLTTGFYDHPARDLSGPVKFPESQAFIALSKVKGGRVTEVVSVLDDLPYLMPAPFGR